MNIAFIALLILIVWLPLPFGSNHAWAWALMEVGIFSLALLWLWQYLRGRQTLTPAFYKAIPILVLWVIWLIYISFQLIPLPYSWVQWLSPQAAQVHAFTNPTFTTLSVAPHSTADGLLKSLSYVLLFTLTLLLVNTQTRLRWIAYVLVFSGLFQALYGSFMTLSGVEYGFFHEKVYGLGLATGTFINRNHVAGYLVMCLSVGIGLLIAQLGNGTTADTWRQRIVAVLSWILSPKMRLRLILVFMVIALVMTHSRMGNTAFFASMLIAGTLALIFSRHANRATVILLVSLIVIDIFIVGTWFGLEKVKQRIEETTFATETRDDVDIDSLPYWQDYFLTGSGLGSYYTTFPRYQNSELKQYYDHAHNDYLEFATETGIVGVLLLGLVVLWSLGVVLAAQFRRQNALSRGIAFGATMAITALLIHSTVDFNLQIPANAATFMLILGLGWVARYLPTQTTNISDNEVSLPPTRLAKTVVWSLMIALTYLIPQAASWGVADAIARRVQASMEKWPQQEIALSEWMPIHNATAYALRLAPNNPALLIRMGYIYHWQGIQLSVSPKEKLAAFQHALNAYSKAVKRNPTNTSIWANILLVKQNHLQQNDLQFITAFDFAAKYGPWKLHAQQAIIDVGLATWYQLPSQVKSIVIATIVRGMQSQAALVRKLIKHHRRQWAVCAYAGDQAELSQLCQPIDVQTK
ncbi:MAG: hypothetical protein DRR19_31160 [Candidatus Parabeggiatoa sp. nov. 1]|nr:MAG: hypothetical protein DRR19_31160 [Gammaproteobacteria bacterium]